MKILVIEDEKKMSGFIQQGLTEVGHSVDVADMPSAARNYLKKSNYELLILDVMLPEVTGIEFAKELRENNYKGNILMLTALSTTKDKITGLDAGADDYLASLLSLKSFLLVFALFLAVKVKILLS